MVDYRTSWSGICVRARLAPVSTPVAPFPALWSGFVDDAAIFPPGNSPLPEAIAAHLGYREEWYADLVGPLVVKDTDLPSVTEPVAVSVVLTGGAGAVAGAAKLASKEPRTLAALEVALRDLDDLAGNARRVVYAVDAALDDGSLADEVPVYVELPHVGSTASWLAAADVVAERGLRLKFRTGGLEEHLFPAPHALASWIGAALDRESPFKCTAGLHNAVRHVDDQTGFTHHGFLNVLLATRASLDGGTVGDVADVLENEDPAALVALVTSHGENALTGARRWFTSYGSCSVAEPLDDLMALGLVTGATDGATTGDDQ
jgi:hypothetical protein